MIVTKGLHIGYKSSIAEVQDIKLDAGVYILIGKNGSGKSTLLKTIAGQLDSIQGAIEINGKEIKSIRKSNLPKLISFVGSKFPDVDFLNVVDYIALGRSPHNDFFGRKTARDAEVIDQAIDTLQIQDLKNRFTSQLSDGERQLAAIAQALTQETSIIILDEPTAFLDYLNKKIVLENLIKISAKFNKCILLSSHDIDLSIDAQRPFLVVRKDTNTIELLAAETSKNTIISIAF